MGSDLGPDSVFALKQIVHRDWRLLSQHTVRCTCQGQLAFSYDKHNRKTLHVENLSWHMFQISNNMGQVHWCKLTQANLIINDIKNILHITSSCRHRLQPKPILCRNGCLNMELSEDHPLPAQNVSLLNCTFVYLACPSLSIEKSLSDP